MEGRLAPFLEASLGKLPIPEELLSNPYPLDGCEDMGMVAKHVVVCSESDYRLLGESIRAENAKALVHVVPDEYISRDSMKNLLTSRGGYLSGRMTVTKTKTSGGVSVETIHVDEGQG